MEIKDKVVVVTGGANGIGRSLCRRFAAEAARAVVVADIDIEGARTLALEIDGLAVEVSALLRESPHIHGFLIRRHGLYTWGVDLAEAARHVEVLEFLLEAVGRRQMMEPQY